MRTLAALLPLLGACGGCQPAASPATDQAVYQQLVSAGCLAPSDGGLAATAAEHAGPNPPWLACLYAGGSVASCRVPCSK